MIIYAGTIGIIFRVQLFSDRAQTQPLDLSDVTKVELAFVNPAGVEVIKLASFVTDGTDGLIEYTSDLTLTSGDWLVQPIITGLNTFTGRTKHSLFRVLKPIGEI